MSRRSWKGGEQLVQDRGFEELEWKEVIRLLDEKYRVIMILYYVEGFRTGEIVHIVLKVYGSDEFPLNDHMGFRDFNAQIDGGKQAFFYAGFMERPEDGVDDWSAGKEYEITLLNEGEGDFYKKEVRLIFSDIVDWYEGKLANTESPVLLESVWELTLLIDNEDSGREYEVDRQVPGSTAVVKRIYLSSVSCIVDYDWEYQTKTETCIDENGVEGTFEHTGS